MEGHREPTWKDMLLSGVRSLPYRDRRFRVSALIVVLAAYLLSGIYSVQPEERGVVVRFGRVVNDGVPPGIHYHLPYPFEKAYKPKTAEIKKVLVGSQEEDVSQGSRAAGLELLTGDTNVILVQVIIQYAISQPRAYLFEAEDAAALVKAASEEALTRIVGLTSVDDLLTTEKLRAQNLIKDRIQMVLDSHGIGVRIIGAYFQDISPPIEVAYAFRDVASAREDKNQAINKADGYRNMILPLTRGEAERLTSDAQAYGNERVERARGEADRFQALLTEYSKSKDLTASRIYVEKMEGILGKMKIYVVDKNGEKNITTLKLMLPGSPGQTATQQQGTPAIPEGLD